ncbi:hypothetical protein D3C80_1310220 [compost metagenome]
MLVPQITPARRSLSPRNSRWLSRSEVVISSAIRSARRRVLISAQVRPHNSRLMMKTAANSAQGGASRVLASKLGSAL